jgi:hypothetical protein
MVSQQRLRRRTNATLVALILPRHVQSHVVGVLSLVLVLLQTNFAEVPFLLLANGQRVHIQMVLEMGLENYISNSPTKLS